MKGFKQNHDDYQIEFNFNDSELELGDGDEADYKEDEDIEGHKINILPEHALTAHTDLMH